jgi:predicted amidohydrolase
MKKPALLFTLKCSVIIYFAACSGIDTLVAAKSVTPQVTKGSWKVHCFESTVTDNTCTFDGYSFVFDINGKVTAEKNGVRIKGSWLEDNINNKITISFKSSNTVLNQLNDYWDVAAIGNGEISFQKKSGSNTDKLYITAL